MKLKLNAFILFIFLNSVFFAQTVPDFKKKTISGKTLELSEVYKLNKVTLLSFWALWCNPCRSEMGKLNSIYEKYQSDGLEIISINIDSPRSSAKVKSYISSHRIKFSVIKDPQKNILHKFNGSSIPFLVLINSEGNIVKQHLGYVPGDEVELEKSIKDLLEGTK